MLLASGGVTALMREPRLRGTSAILLGGFLALATALTEARSKLPLIADTADPCTEACTFNLCVLDGELQRCARRCGLVDARVVLPAERPVIVKLPPQYPQARRGARAELRCLFVGRPCWPCHADADCDDGDPAKLDLCLSPSCAHICPGG